MRKKQQIAVLPQGGLMESSGKVVLTAVAMWVLMSQIWLNHSFHQHPTPCSNGSNFLFKLMAWIYTGSHSMFAECLHSLADTINQLILAYGIHKSSQVSCSNELIRVRDNLIFVASNPRPSLRIYEHAVCGITCFRGWHLLHGSWPVGLPWGVRSFKSRGYQLL